MLHSLPSLFHRLSTTLKVVACLAVSSNAGCVALISERADFSEVLLSAKTQDEVLSALGQPLRRESQSDGEAWFYRLSGSGLAGRAVTHTQAGAVLLVPMMSSTSHSENVKLIFQDKILFKAFELTSQSSSFACGVGLAHGLSPVCGAGSTSTATAAANLAHRRLLGVVADAELPTVCAVTTTSASEVACRVRDFLLSIGAGTSPRAYHVHDLGTSYAALISDQESSKPNQVAIVQKRSGLVAMHRQHPGAQ
jgi:hypothetical protein